MKKNITKKDMRNVLGNIPRIEWNMIVAALLLSCFGAMMQYSITGKIGEMLNHFGFALAGLVFILIFQYCNYHILAKFAGVVYFAAIVCILLLKTPLGHSVNGATRWLNIGFQFQVAEAVKFAIIIMLAWFVWKFYGVPNKYKLAIYIWAIGGIPAVLLMTISNDLSSSIVVLAITFIVSFICTETPKLHFAVFALVVLVAVIYVWGIYRNLPTETDIRNLPFRDQRIAAWLAPERYASDASYQSSQGRYALGSGGWTGKGLGMSVQKGKLPEAENDFVIPIIAEELGILGLSVLFLLMGFLTYMIYLVARDGEKSIFGRTLAIGVMAHLGIQSLINMLVATEIFPNTGLTLPFISNGGTSLLICMVEVGIVVAVERRSVLQQVEKQLESL